MMFECFDRVLTDDECRIVALSEQLSAIAAVPMERRTPWQRAAAYEYFIQNAAAEPIRQSWEKLLQSAREAFAKYGKNYPRRWSCRTPENASHCDACLFFEVNMTNAAIASPPMYPQACRHSRVIYRVTDLDSRGGWSTRTIH